MHLRHKQQGFSLLEIGIVLTLLAGLSMILVAQNREQAPIYSDTEMLHIADKQLRSFMAANARLPCADINDDGVEDCGSTAKGQLPYVTLGLNRQLFTSGGNAMRYGVYRNPHAEIEKDADLAVANVNRFQPLRSNDNPIASQVINTADFCQALENALENGHKLGVDINRTFVRSGASQGNVAYALAMPGKNDSDGANGLFDDLNGRDPLGFNTSGTVHDNSYDDQVLSRTFTELKQEQQCDLLLTSLSLIARGIETEESAVNTAESNFEAIKIGAILAGVGTGLSTVDLIMSSIDVITGVIKMAEAVGQMVAAIASCVVGVGCTQIPRLVAAIVAGTAALALSAVAVGAATVALALQIVATVAYAGTAIAAGVIADQAKRPEEMDDAINSMNDSLTSARQNVTDTETKLNAAKASQPSVKQEAQDSLNALTSYISSHGQNADPGSSNVISTLNSANALQKEVSQQQTDYDDKEGKRQSAKSKCDSFDPPKPDDQSCLDEQTYSTQTGGAKQALDQKKQALQNTKTQLISDSSNYPVKNGLDPDGNQLYAPCSTVAGCNLKTLAETALSKQQADIDKANEIDTLEKELAANKTNVSELEGTVAAMSCNDQGKVYTAADKSCTAPADSSGEEITLTRGAQGALELIDARILSGQ